MTSSRLRVTPLIRDVARTSLLSLLARAVGLSVPIVIAHFFGVSERTDSFFLVYAFMMFVTMTFATALETTLVPFIVERKRDTRGPRLFLGQVYFSAFIIAILLGPIGYFLAGPPLARYARLSPEAVALAGRYFLETLPMVLFLMWNSILVAHLNSHSRFAAAVSSPLIRSAISVVSILAFHRHFGVEAVPLGYSLGEGLRFLFLTLAAARSRLQGFTLVWRFDADFLAFVKVAFYQMAGLLAVGANPFIDRTMATRTQLGGVSILEYSEKIYLIPVLLVTSGVFTVLLPRWSSINSDGDFRKLRAEVKKAMLYVVALALAITLPLLVGADFIVTHIYGSGIKDARTLSLISTCTMIYLVGVPLYLLGQIIIRALLAMKLTRWIMTVSIIKTVLNVLLNLLFMAVWGVVGIVVSTTVNSLVVLLMLAYHFWRHAAGPSRTT